MINNDNIDELISKFLSGEASPEEAMLLEDWKQATAENLAHFNRSEKTFAMLRGLTPTTEPDAEQAWQRIAPELDKQQVKPLYPKTQFIRIAAAILLLLGIGAAVTLMFNNRKEDLSYVAGNTAKQVKLPDGSDVTVLPNSTLMADKGFGTSNRLLHLTGNATFSVVHDENIPFVIDAGDVFIKDIGTRFTVRSSPDTDTVYVHVDEGIVLLFDSLGSELEIKATENALYIRSSKRIVKPIAATVTQPATRLDFNNQRLGDVIEALNKTYHISISLEHASVANCTITTRFENEDAETIISIIAETLGLSYEKTDKGYIIKGRACHS